MNSRSVLLVALVGMVLAASATGCAPAQVYFYDRIMDAWDMFSIQVMFGEGIMFNVRPTKLAQIGAGFYKVQKVGFFGRQAGHWLEKRNEWGVSLIYMTDYRKELLFDDGIHQGNEYMVEYFKNHATPGTDLNRQSENYVIENVQRPDIYLDEDRHWLSLGFVLMPLKMGFDIEIRNVEIYDFIAGWFMIDPSWDDTRHRDTAPPIQPGVYSLAAPAVNEAF